MKLYYKICTWATLSACALQLLLVVSSWLLTAASPDLYLRSLLSGEGLRWLFGRFTVNLQSPVLVWMLLLGVAYGAMKDSGIVGAIRKKCRGDYRTRVALQLVACEAIAIVVVLALLTLPPHAILLSATGQLLPSSFTSGLIPVVAFTVSAMSLTFAVMVGRLKTVCDAFLLMTQGITIIAPLMLAYIFIAELYHSLLFVLGA